MPIAISCIPEPVKNPGFLILDGWTTHSMGQMHAEERKPKGKKEPFTNICSSNKQATRGVSCSPAVLDGRLMSTLPGWEGLRGKQPPGR